jgi:hypothetical protein
MKLFPEEANTKEIVSAVHTIWACIRVDFYVVFIFRKNKPFWYLNEDKDP